MLQRSGKRAQDATGLCEAPHLILQARSSRESAAASIAHIVSAMFFPFFRDQSAVYLGSMLAKLANCAKMGCPSLGCFLLAVLLLVALVVLPHPLSCLPHSGACNAGNLCKTAKETHCAEH